MGMVQKAYIIMLCMNLFLAIYINDEFNTGQNTILGKFIDISGDKVSLEGTDLASSTPSTLVEDTAVVGTETLSLASALNTIWNFIRFILLLLFAPIVIIYIVPNIPVVAGALFVLPTTLILIFGTISFIKGSDW